MVRLGPNMSISKGAATNRSLSAGTVLQCKTLAATTDPGMLEFLRSVLAVQRGSYKMIPITIQKGVSICDIITPDRAVTQRICRVCFTANRPS
jgi:hypothetical protein